MSVRGIRFTTPWWIFVFLAFPSAQKHSQNLKSEQLPLREKITSFYYNKTSRPGLAEIFAPDGVSGSDIIENFKQ